MVKIRDYKVDAVADLLIWNQLVDGASVVIASGLYVWYRETRIKN